MKKKRVLILGAAGRDFHNFNVVYRDNEEYEVTGFTATQIPNIEDRLYPVELAGGLYPGGIPIYPEEKMVELIQEKKVDMVVFSYSDISYDYIMHKASLAIASGADAYVTGEIGYHDFIEYGSSIMLIDATHRATELPVLKKIENRLKQSNSCKTLHVILDIGKENIITFRYNILQ